MALMMTSNGCSCPAKAPPTRGLPLSFLSFSLLVAAVALSMLLTPLLLVLIDRWLAPRLARAVVANLRRTLAAFLRAHDVALADRGGRREGLVLRGLHAGTRNVSAGARALEWKRAVRVAGGDVSVRYV